MVNFDEQLDIAMFIKIYKGEAVSLSDAERYINFLANRPLKLVKIEESDVANLRIKLKSVFQQYMNDGNQ